MGVENLVNKTLQEIGDKNINPLPRWHFEIKNRFAWLAFFLFVAGSAAAVAQAVFLWAHKCHGCMAWFLAAGVMVGLLHLSFQRTKWGYRFNPKKAMALSVAVFLIIIFFVLLFLW